MLHIGYSSPRSSSLHLLCSPACLPPLALYQSPLLRLSLRPSMPRYPSSDYTASTDDRQGFFGAPEPSSRYISGPRRTDERQGYFGAPDPTASAAGAYYPPHQHPSVYPQQQQPLYHGQQQAAPHGMRPMSHSQRPTEQRRIEDEESGWDLPEESNSSVLRCLCFVSAAEERE